MKFERIAIGGGAILYDPSRAGNAPAALFDLDAWRRRGAAREMSGGRGSIVFLGDDAQGLVLRRYLRGGFAARFSRDAYFYTGERRTRAFHELRLLGALVELDLPVPAPVAARYVRTGLAYRAELVTARLPPCDTLAARWLAGSMRIADWRAVGACLRRFHRAGVQHVDLNANNVMLGSAGQVWLLDFDRGRLRPPGPWQDAVLARLERSLAKLAGLNPGAPDWREGMLALRSAHDGGA